MAIQAGSEKSTGRENTQEFPMSDRGEKRGWHSRNWLPPDSKGKGLEKSEAARIRSGNDD